jgi:6-phospho-beta-glucosidase
MILTILGGSAYSTPLLVQLLAKTRGETDLTVRLAGLNPGSLSAVARAARILSDGFVAIEEFGEGEWKAALSGSEIVVIQVRVGHYDARHFDETFPLEHGIPGDEGLGPGGLSAAWRGWPHIRVLCRCIQRYAPRAQTILLSSPGSLLVRLAGMEFPGWPLTAVCELPFTTLQQICAVGGVPFDEVSFEYAGVNHMGWLYAMEWRAEDVLARYKRCCGSNGFPPVDLLSRLNAFPLKYLRLHYEQAAAVEEQRQRINSRARELQALATDGFEVYRRGDSDGIEAALHKRKAEWYTGAVAPLIRFWMGEDIDIDTPLFLTVACGEVRERRYSVRAGKLQLVSQRKRPGSEVEETLEKFVEYERVAAKAIFEGTEEALSEALCIHPWVAGGRSANALAAQIVSHSNVTFSSDSERKYIG